MNAENLISLGDRPLEERREIARLGGLARQEQRRKQFALRRALNGMLEAENLISKYCKKPKSKKSSNFKLKNISTFGINYFSNLRADLLEAYENFNEELKEEEKLELLRKKQIRKEINRRYYLKHRKK